MTIVWCLTTILVYVLSKRVNQRYNHVLLHPLLISPLFLIVLITAAQISPEQYAEGTKLLTYGLGPATVAFAVPIYKHLPLIKKHLSEVFFSIMVGTVFSIVSSAVFSHFIHLSQSFINSLMPRSITTPIAIEISEEIGGLPALTAVFVICTGITGAVVGPSLIKLFAFRSSVAKGMMMGVAAHGTGTAKAFEYGNQEGTFSSIAMVLCAVITMIWANSWIPYFQHFF